MKFILKTILCHTNLEEMGQFSFFFKIYLCVWVFCLHICLRSTCVPGACGSQKRVLGSLQLELQTVVASGT